MHKKFLNAGERKIKTKKLMILRGILTSFC